MSQAQKSLVGQITLIHEELRRKFRKVAEADNCSNETSKDKDEIWEKVWKGHTEDHEGLHKYSEAMFNLANIWDSRNSEASGSSKIRCRIEWVFLKCQQYFKPKLLVGNKLKLLDVGSCYNPFSKYEDTFDTIALDLHPAPGFETVVYNNDFLKLDISKNSEKVQECLETKSQSHSQMKRLSSLPAECFDAVVFSFVLEYLPNAKQRLECCLRANKLLKPSGLVFILRPDSNSVTPSTSKWLKQWKVGLGLIGFKRVFLEKLEHLWCTAYSKLENEHQARQFVESQRFKNDVKKLKEEIIEGEIFRLFSLPQDYYKDSSEVDANTSNYLQRPLEELDKQLLSELPFDDQEISSFI